MPDCAEWDREFSGHGAVLLASALEVLKLDYANASIFQAG
jgi:hypothetical protein